MIIAALITDCTLYLSLTFPFDFLLKDGFFFIYGCSCFIKLPE